MIRLAADAALFVLDDEAGLFFSESRQELYVFNTAATFVWCCLEEGLAPDAVAARYAETFAVADLQAAQAVSSILEQWQGLGYLSGLPPDRQHPLDFTTALGRLLASPGTRRDFARSPAEVARRVGQGEAELALLALDPDGIEAQVEALAYAERRMRGRAREPGAGVALESAQGAGRSLLERAVEARRPSLAAPDLHGHYRLVGTDFCVRYPSAAVKATVHPAFAHLAAEAAEAADVSTSACPLALLAEADGYLLSDGALPVACCRGPEEIAPLIRGTLQHLASEASEHLLQIHAGVISDGEVATLLPGAPGSGKTTLTASAAKEGFQYFSEELALLEDRTLHVRPMPLPLTLKPGSLEPLSGLYEGLADLAPHLREDGEVVRYLPPPDSALRYEHERSYPVRRIVFPRYLPGVATELRPLAKAEALERLMRECLVLPDLLDRRKVEDLVHWVRTLACFELRLSDLAQATRLLLAAAA